MHVCRPAVAPARVDSPRSGIDSFGQIPRNSEYRSAWCDAWHGFEGIIAGRRSRR